MPKILTEQDFISGNVPSKNAFKKSILYLRRQIKNFDGIVYASFLGSAAKGNASYTSDIDIFIVYSHPSTQEFVNELRACAREALRKFKTPVEIHATPLSFLEKGIVTCNGSLGASIKTASQNQYAVIKHVPSFDLITALRFEPHPISGFFFSKHMKVIKKYMSVDLYSRETIRSIESYGEYNKFLQKLLQIPHHTLRNVLFYANEGISLGETDAEVRKQWLDAFGTDLLERYCGLFEIETNYKNMIVHMTQNEFVPAIYWQSIEAIENNIFRYLDFVEEATMLLFKEKTAH